MNAKTEFFYQTQAARHQLDAGTAATTNQACYAREMAERAKFAEDMLARGESAEAAFKYYQTGELA